MKRTLAILVMLASGLVLNAAAQTQAAPAAATPAEGAAAIPARIAVVRFQLAVAQTNEGQRDFADIEKKYAPKQASLKSLSDEVDSLTKELQTPSASLTDTERASKAKSLDEKKKQLDRDMGPNSEAAFRGLWIFTMILDAFDSTQRNHEAPLLPG